MSIDKMMSRLVMIGLVASAFGTAKADDVFSIPPDTANTLKQFCRDCHSGDSAEGNLQLDTLTNLGRDERLEVLNKVQEQIYFRRMPPNDAEQPSETERQLLAGWVSKELKKFGASKLEDKLQKPEYGNTVDHDKLFSGEYANLKGFTYDRRWLISEFIFDAKFNRILNHNPFQTIDGKREFVIGDNNRRVNLTNPFLLPTNTGVRYYANETLDGGHLLTMITNAKEAATYMMYLTGRDKRYLPAIGDIMAQEWEHEKILASRETHLNNFIDRILQDLYKDRHEALLPTFVRVDVPSVDSTNGDATKKAPFHAANPGTQELEVIFRSMRRHQKPGDTHAQLIEKCEREWFNFGHNERKIEARITFLNNYMEEWRKQIVSHNLDKRYRRHEYRPADANEMQAITETILKHRKKGDRYNTIIRKCMAQWKEEFQQQRTDAGPPNTTRIAALVDQLFLKILERSPTSQETEKFVALTQSYIESMGNQKAIEKLIQTVFLRSDFVYRYEFGQGESDADGLRMLSPRDASYAIAYALTDSSPDQQLIEAAESGKLNTREDYRREVLRLLKNRDQYYVIDEAVQRLQLTASIT
ncbi:MAG: DUF1592 domain-containing protein, partial [Planctomycetaceae bacterium]|nr:DUF1592 domain-containing protein [Planctomycetaceae bacterium]